MLVTKKKVTVILSERGLAHVTTSCINGGVAYLSARLNDGGMASEIDSPSEESVHSASNNVNEKDVAFVCQS